MASKQLLFVLLCFSVALAVPIPNSPSDKIIVVAADGSGNYKTVSDAVKALPDNSKNWTEIYIKPGTYKEHIIIPSTKTFLKLFGGGKTPEDVVLEFDITTSDKNFSYGDTGAFVAANNDFYGQDITFSNTHGAGTQAIAATFTADRQQCNNCIFKGYQDTLFLAEGTQYFNNCTIHGAVDFIYGGATAVLENCIVNSVAGGALTAPNTKQDVAYGLTFLKCDLTANSGVGEGSTYLGRTWGPYAKADYLNCNEGEHIAPVGWNNMGNPSYQPTVRLGEYENSGKGFQPSKRVSWSSQLTASEAASYTVQKILAGWTPVSLDAKHAW